MYLVSKFKTMQNFCRAVSLRSSKVSKDDELKNFQLSHPLVDLLRTYYCAGGYCLMSPFLYHKLPGNFRNIYVVQKRGVTFQILMLCSNLWILFSIAFEKWFYVQQPKETKFQFYLSYFLTTIWILTLAVAMIAMWTNGKSLNQTLITVGDISEKFEELGVTIPSKTKVGAIAILLIALMFLWSIQELAWKLLFEDVFLSHELMMKRACKHTLLNCASGISAGNLSGLAENSVLPHEIEISMPLIIFEMLLYLRSYILGELANRYCHCLLLAHAIVYYIIVRQLIVFIQTQRIPGHKHNLILDIFEDICELCDVMDKSIGSIVATGCFVTVEYFAFVSQRLFSQPSPLNTFLFFVYGLAIGSFLYLAAEANSKLEYLRRWLQIIRKEKKFASFEERADWQDRIYIALNQLQSGQIGIRGGSFTITYGFAGSMVSLILTYSVLISQLSGGPSTSTH